MIRNTATDLELNSLLVLADGMSGGNGSRVIEEMEQRRPPLILLENVPGFLTSHGGRDFQEALLTLQYLGCKVA